MNLSELRQLVRTRTRDSAAPYAFSDEEIDANLNEAQSEACERAHLIEGELTIDITTTELRYDLDPRIIDVLSISINLDSPREFTGWTLTETQLVLDRYPTSDDTLTLNCYLLPENEMTGDGDEPEIRAVYHRKMADWAISLCFLIPDTDIYDGNAAERYANSFIKTFGDKPDARARRNQRDKSPRVVTCNNYI